MVHQVACRSLKTVDNLLQHAEVFRRSIRMNDDIKLILAEKLVSVACSRKPSPRSRQQSTPPLNIPSYQRRESTRTSKNVKVCKLNQSNLAALETTQYSNAFLSFRTRNATRNFSNTASGGRFLQSKHLVFKNGVLEPGLKPHSIAKVVNLNDALPKDVLKQRFNTDAIFEKVGNLTKLMKAENTRFASKDKQEKIRLLIDNYEQTERKAKELTEVFVPMATSDN